MSGVILEKLKVEDFPRSIQHHVLFMTQKWGRGTQYEEEKIRIFYYPRLLVLILKYYV